MNKTAIMTDSTASLPAELIEKLKISVVPLDIIWDDQTYEDGVTLKPNEFYDRLQKTKKLPSTSQPSIGKIQKVMTRLVEQDYHILGIFLSSRISGTFQAALQARELSPNCERILIFDSQTTTLAMGFQVLATARAAQSGASLEDCQKLADYVRINSGVFFMVDTLEFLHRGGRIGGAQRFLGTTLGTKPILFMNNGKIDSLERVRTKSKAIDRLQELVVEKCAGKQNIRLAAVHANAANDAANLLQKASQQVAPIETLMAELSPVIGLHAGPGTVALAYFADL